MNWQPIDTAPLDQHVLVCEGDAVGEAHHVENNGWWWAGNHPSDSWGSQIYPSHWMPLPPPFRDAAPL